MDKQEKEIEGILRTFDKAPSPSSERNNHAQMRQNNLQSRQVSQNPIDAERTVRTTNQTANKRKPPSSKGRYPSPKRKAAIKRRKRQRIAIVSILRGAHGRITYHSGLHLPDRIFRWLRGQR